MRVQPPPAPVPRLIVTNSRMVLRSPMASSTRSPPYFLSCGSPPSAAWLRMRLSRPMRVGPWMLQCGPTSVPAPISTSAPMKVKAPTRTSSASMADGSITAVGWISGAFPLIGGPPSGLFARTGAHDFRAGDQLAIDHGLAVVHRHVADHALDFHMHFQHVAGHDLVAEA